MCLDRHEQRLSGLAERVLVLDWDTAVPFMRSGRDDPRLPDIAKAPGFRDWIATGWDADADRSARVDQGFVEAAWEHRARLSECFPGQTLLIASGRAQLRANDTFFEFRADSDFLWLLGHGIEGAVLELAPRDGGHACTLYLTPPARPGDAAFFESANYGELWVGPLAGLAEWSEALGMRVRPLDELDVPAGALIAGAPVVDARVGARLGGRPRSNELVRRFAIERMVKDDWEISEIRRAVAKTIDGFAAVSRELPAAVRAGGERWLQGTFDRHARTVGQAPGYATIVGAGAHAPVLHWVRADGELTEGELVLLDMGVENRTGYTADITRTLPIGGAFSAAQRQVHELVERAHKAALGAVAPGRPWSAFQSASMEVLAQGLHDWGLLPVSVDEALSAAGQHHRRFIVCPVGHHVGLDVHDCEAAPYESYAGGLLAAGMVTAVEPGLYFHDWDETVPPELRGIGVRIEDDVLVTAAGSEALSAALPFEADGLETWMRRAAADEGSER